MKPTDAPATRQLRRSWPQRLLLVLNCLLVVACLAGAAALVVARNVSNSIGRVELAAPSPGTANAAPTTSPSAVATTAGGTAASSTAPESSGPVETYPVADLTARNFLITGADNNACIEPDSPYASAFGDRTEMGERSDTIMLMRVDPATGRAAVLSFPRDLWVQIAGRQNKNRINTAYVKDDPQRLIDTIYQNFGLGVDHFIQVDFCAFKNIVDAVGGVAVPFEYPARDTHSGLDVPTAGCFTFTGDHALAYVRSRYYQYYKDGTWQKDGLSDLGRVSRQQDFIRRALAAALDKGITNPSVARGLIETAQENVVVDSALSIDKMLEFAGVLRNLDPDSISSYQIEAEGANISGQSVLVPRIKGDNMRAILAIFRGEAPLAGAPEQVFETTTTTSTTSTTTTVPATTTTGKPTGTTVAGTTTTTSSTTTTTSTTVAPTTLPATTVAPEENAKGIVPPRDVSC
jgi:LCP family protein required for cell wall assembly